MIISIEYIYSNRTANDSYFDHTYTDIMTSNLKLAEGSLNQIISEEYTLDKTQLITKAFNQIAALKTEITEIIIGACTSIKTINHFIEMYKVISPSLEDYDNRLIGLISGFDKALSNLGNNIGNLSYIPYYKTRSFNKWYESFLKYAYDTKGNAAQLYILQEIGINALQPYFGNESEIMNAIRNLINSLVSRILNSRNFVNPTSESLILLQYQKDLCDAYVWLNANANYDKLPYSVLSFDNRLAYINNIDFEPVLSQSNIDKIKEIDNLIKIILSNFDAAQKEKLLNILKKSK